MTRHRFVFKSLAIMMTMPAAAFADLLEAHAESVGSELARRLADQPAEGEIARPPRLMAAARHGVLNGGKRLRPFLVLETAHLFGGSERAAKTVACALECLHSYSLIHDDLPAMDDDDLRRGQPTVHRAFDEATAILAGDGLLTFAFDILSEESGDIDPRARLQLVSGLAKAAGFGGMVGGQALDLEAEREAPGEAGIITLQAMKTGALLRYACEAGAVLSGVARDDRERMREFGSAIGLAFQLADDVLDLTADASMLGKATGKDAARGKATLAGLHGVQWAQSQLRGLVEQAIEMLEPYGDEAASLRAAAHFVADRRR